MDSKKVAAWIQLVLGVLVLIGSIVAVIILQNTFTEKANKSMKDIRTFYDTTKLSLSDAEKTFQFNRQLEIITQGYYTHLLVIYFGFSISVLLSILLISNAVISLNEY